MIGKRISGRYKVLERVGGGGMANVYRALDIILDREVAVKILQPQFSDDEQFIRRFRREAQAATSLAHPNIVTIYDVGEEGNTYYIVMEYIEGQTLKERIQEQGALPVQEALNYMEQMLSALAHAHANHLIHRDIKPHNILIRHDGVVKITDFGIARAISAATITHTNSIMGSVHYLSPEQARGGHVTYKSDIYSLGIVLYEMITGDLPFSGDTAVSIAIKHLQNEVPSAKEKIPNLPQSVENIILKATVKDPIVRYESVYEMEEDIATALSPERMNEPPFQTNVDDEITKAIPIIADVADYDDVEKTVAVTPPVRDREETVSQAQTNKPSKKKKGRKWFISLLIVALLLVGSVIVAFTIIPSLFKVDEVEVPNVIEMPFEEAEQLIKSLHLSVEREDVEEEGDIPAGHVVRQNPLPETTVKENTVVTLFVNTGPEQIEIDNYIGMSVERAESLLRELNFQVKRVAKETNDEAPGIVIAQEPSKGTFIPTETTVTLTYSVESEIRLKNLIGEAENVVKQYLNDVHLVGRYRTEYSNTVPAGYVISQTPDPFTVLRVADEVSIVISKGPEPKPEPTVPKEPDEEPTFLYEVRQEVFVDDEDREAGNTFDIKIVYRDAETEGKDKVFIHEKISETTTYSIPLRVSPSQNGSFELFINGEVRSRSETYSYPNN